MHDKSTLDNNFDKNKKFLIEEKKKAVSHCINLEFKKEQLKMLIEKLNQLSTKRENLNMKNSNLSYELKIAQDNNIKLEREISEVKGKIVKIDESLSE